MQAKKTKQLETCGKFGNFWLNQEGILVLTEISKYGNIHSIISSKLSEINLIEIDLCFNDIMEIILLKWPFISIKLLKFALLK